MKYIEFSGAQRAVLLAALEEACDFWNRWSPPSRWKNRLQRVRQKAAQDCVFTRDEVLLIYEAILGVPSLDEEFEEILHVCHDAVGDLVSGLRPFVHGEMV